MKECRVLRRLPKEGFSATVSARAVIIQLPMDMSLAHDGIIPHFPYQPCMACRKQ